MKDAFDAEIVIIGAAVIDVLACPVEAEVFQSGSYAAENICMSVGADALNEATILAKMGKRVQLETIIGTDPAGKYLLQHLRDQKIQVSKDCIRENEVTGINVVLVEPDGKRSFLTNPNSTLRRLTLKDIHMPFTDEVKIVCFASIFVFPEIGAEELRKIFAQARSQGKIVCADMTKRKHGETLEDMAPALAYVDYLFPNDEEALLLTGTGTVEEAADRLKKAGVGNVIIKCGKRGCFLQNDVETAWIPAEEGVQCIDTTGAGDSFAAGFLCALLDGKSAKECAQYGNQCGAKAVGVVGATEWMMKK